MVDCCDISEAAAADKNSIKPNVHVLLLSLLGMHARLSFALNCIQHVCLCFCFSFSL